MTEQESLLDRAVGRARDGKLTIQSVLWTLAASTLFVPSGAEPGDDLSGFRALYFPKDETQMLAVYTTADRAGSVGELAPWMVSFSAAFRQEIGI